MSDPSLWMKHLCDGAGVPVGDRVALIERTHMAAPPPRYVALDWEEGRIRIVAVTALFALGREQWRTRRLPGKPS